MFLIFDTFIYTYSLNTARRDKCIVFPLCSSIDSKTFLLEGDIEITTDRNSIKCKSNTCLWPKSGSQVIIPYTTSLKYSKPGQRVFLLACFILHKFCNSFASIWCDATN